MEIKSLKLDTSKIIVPKGYKVIIDPEIIEQEKVREEKLNLEKQLLEMVEPTDEELIQYGRAFHPYYEIKNKLN